MDPKILCRLPESRSERTVHGELDTGTALRLVQPRN